LWKKRWSGVFVQEPFNEVIATAIMKRLGVYLVPYTIAFEKAAPYSLCENFVGVDTEFIPARRVVQSVKRRNNDPEFTHLLRCCDVLGIGDCTGEVDRMLTVDYIIANEDRHYNNFGFLRNPDTLEWLGFAPVFDGGTSLWFNTLRVGGETECKPFRKTHEEQIKLVGDLSWFDLGVLDGFEGECDSILLGSSLVDFERRNVIVAAVLKRIDYVEMAKIVG